MSYFKIIENEELVQLGTSNSYIPTNAEEITGEEYAELLAEFERKVEEEAEANKPQNDYGVPDETYNNIIDDYTASITEEVASNGY